MMVKAARSSEMYMCSSLHGNTTQNTAAVVYTTVYFFIHMGQFLDSSCDWHLFVTNAHWPVTRCLPLYHRRSAGFPHALCVCHLWLGHVCMNVRHRNKAATLYHLLGMYVMSQYCVSVFTPKEKILLSAYCSTRL
jgi:hypothetical protein